MNLIPLLKQQWKLPVRHANIHAARMKAAVINVLSNHNSVIYRPDGEPHFVSVGDWVCWKLGGYERLCLAGSAAIVATHKFKAKWSLPAEVIAVRDKVANITTVRKCF